MASLIDLSIDGSGPSIKNKAWERRSNRCRKNSNNHSLLKRLFDVEFSCAITDMSAVCCVSASESCVGDRPVCRPASGRSARWSTGSGTLVTASEGGSELGHGVIDGHALAGET